MAALSAMSLLFTLGSGPACAQSAGFYPAAVGENGIVTVDARDIYYDGANGTFSAALPLPPGATKLQFRAVGGVDTASGSTLTSADGIFVDGNVPFNSSARYAGTYQGVPIGTTTGVDPALFGVFFSAAFSGTPADSLNFRADSGITPDPRTLPAYTPSVNQPFYIGDGYDANNPFRTRDESYLPPGSNQTFTIPAGATHLLLGIGSDVNLSDNSLFFRVRVFSDVAPPAAAKLVFSVPPGNGSAGYPLAAQPKVAVQDGSGKPALGYNGPVSLAIKAGTGTAGAVLLGTTAINAVNGLAAFTDVAVDRMGTGFRLTASAGALPAVDSPAFNVAATSIIRVTRTGDDAKDGSSWPNAKSTITGALAAAADGTEIWVATGTYTERITLRANTRLYGGFAGAESTRAQRDFRTNLTTLDGGNAGTVVSVSGGSPATTAIDGFTIRNGAASHGGGLWCEGGSPRIANNVFSGNRAGSTGGAVRISNGSAPALLNNTFIGNSAVYGGAVYGIADVNPVIAGNTFARNTATYGAAVFLDNGAGGSLRNNLLFNNSGSNGALCTYGTAFTQIANNTIVSNGSGGVYNYGNAYPTLVNNMIALNSYGFYRESGGITLRNSDVYGNGLYAFGNMPDPTGSAGNISANPAFVGPAVGNYHILPASPARDAGDDSAVQAGDTDLDGQARIQGAHVDIGADENDGSGSAAAAAVIRVSPSGNDFNDGSTWPLAKKTVQGALNVASSGDEVWVQAGTYAERIGLRLGAGLYGGFTGAETARASRNPAVNVTILDAGSSGSVVTVPTGATASTVLDGFTIQHGAGQAFGAFGVAGGGIFCDAASPTISGNIITANGAANGGGMFISNKGTPVVSGNTISGNSASGWGGGVYVYSASPAISGNAINSNAAGSSGGGIACYTRSSPTITGNAFTGNSAGGGAAIICQAFSSPLISGNAITGQAGAYTILVDNASSPTIANNTIRANAGVGVYGDSNSAPLVLNNLIRDNGSHGVATGTTSTARITGNAIVSNAGAGVYMGGYSRPVVANNIIGWNLSGAYKEANSAPAFRSNDVFANQNNEYENWPDQTGTNGNISADPLLASLPNGNFHILPSSPARDAGDDSAVTSGQTDLDGQARIQGAHVDIGVDESNGSSVVVPPTIIRVKPDGDDAKDGSTWPNAKKTVQSAVNAASGGGDVWVAAGTYKENATLRYGVRLFGGFAGTETAQSGRNVRANVTTLDGSGGRALYSPPGGYASGVIDGFTIVNGSADRGGGIRCDRSSPAIRNNVISGNSATYGGGVFLSQSTAAITNNTITGNAGASYGGAIWIDGASSPAIRNNVITRNRASAGSAAYMAGSNATFIGNNTIGANTATNASGGAVYIDGASPQLVNNIIAFNSSGIYRSSGAPTFRCNCVHGNADSNYTNVTDPTGTDGNNSVNPKLASVVGDNWHIQATSPCREAGDNAAAVAGDTDLDGQNRIQGARVDIGADESDNTSYSTPPRIIRVSKNGDDANDGSDWTKAKLTVQAAINASLGGSEIWVSKGSYAQSVNVSADVSLYGGFAGSESLRTQRNAAANATILDGTANGNTVTISSGTQGTVQVDGFTVRAGSEANGFYITGPGASPIISNNTLTASARGLFCDNGSTPVVYSNTFTGNYWRGDGGALYSDRASPIVRSNVFYRNAAGSHGGALYIYFGSGTFANNTIVANSCAPGYQGGGIIVNSASPTIVNNIVAYNTSGLYVFSGAPVVRNNIFYGNTAYDYGNFADPTGASGNLKVDPKLASVQSGNLHIANDSPARNAGDDTVAVVGDVDFENQPRIQGAHVDIGADESDGTGFPVGLPVVRVSPAGDDANSGADWTKAKKTIQAGLDAAIGGGEVWVAAGTYAERLTLKANAAAYGGFSGSETSRSQRNVAANSSTLDGTGGTAVFIPSTMTPTATVDGFTIVNSNYGIQNQGASATIRNNRVTGSRDTGIFVQGGSPTLQNNAISGNGTGIYIDTSGTPAITANIVSDNGRGLFSSYSSPTLVSNVFWNNHLGADHGAGLYLRGGSPQVINNTIIGNVNRSDYQGAGVYTDGNPTLLFVNNIVALNVSGFYRGDGSITFRNNDAYGNTFYNYRNVTDPTGADGNASADPSLAFAPNGNVHIQPNSPARDAGDDSVVLAGQTDFDGQPRIQGAHVDIGADESDGAVFPVGLPVVRVSPAGDDANSGADWTKAKKTIQAGLDAAIGGGEVWVAAGEYQERLVLKASVGLYGGFAGNEAARAQRNAASSLTSVNGTTGTAVFIGPGLTASAVLDGFTIVNSNYGIQNQGASATIRNNRVTGSRDTGVFVQGGSPTLQNNAISGNGTGIYIDTSGTPAITANIVSDNGRGLFSSYSSPTLVSNVFWNNHLGADHGAGLYLRGGSPQVINNTIIGNVNRSDYQGAGVYTDGNPTVLFVNNILAFNVSGFYRGDGSITFRNNDAYGNFVYDYGNVADPTGTNGNVRVNPAVADVKRGNAHIQATSPLLNNGDDSAVAAGQTDFDGQPRVQGAHVDIGADESDGIASYTALPVVVRVSPSGDDANDGSDWTKAKKTIQAALDAAPGGGEVWVAAGAYTGGVRLNANVALYGGFAGTETAREQRDWTTHVASIDGVGGVTVYISPMTLSTGVLDGFVIRNGNTGIQCVGSSPVLRNNSVTANSTGIVLNTASPLIDGNAIFANGREGIVGDGSPTVTNNVVNANNPANNSLHGINVTGAPPTIANNKVTNNGGRGISVSPGPTVFSENRVSGNFLEGIAYGGAAGSIINNRVSNNRNAGIYVNGGGPAVSGNTVTGNGTGISADSGSTSVITGNTMSGNLGRGFAADATAVTVTNNTIADNLGGGVNLGGGFPTLLNNVIRGNAITNDVGAGILLRAGAALVANNTIVNNTTNYNGGGIYFRDSAYPTVSNNIIAFNSSGLYRESGGTTLKSNDVYGNADYDYANMPDATGASGNLKADPRLADLRNNNVHIQPDSPARNAGDDAVVSAGETDMDGQARVQGSHVDIGADESDGTTFTPARAVVFVSSTGRDSNDGTTWERAKGTVRNAIGAANGGEEVWVAKGVYKERIALKSGVTLLGGFAGAETDKSQRDYAANPTILDGSGGGSVVTIPLGTAMTATVDGFTIRNSGNAGSGVLFSGGSATFRNNIVTGNGNGVYNDGGSPKILNNLIYGNLRGVYSQFGSPLFANNVVRNNRYATDHGIGFYLRGGAPTLQNNTIAANVHNTNYAGAGLYAMAGSVVTMVNNIVAYNVSGVYKESDCTISLRGNCFFYNQSYDYGNMASATGTNGNIRQDPQFADLASGDVHINVSSACRNAGDSTAVTAGQLDLDGQPRIQDGVVDIGADESNGTLYNRPPVVIRVKPAGDDSADGASWATARKTVQAAIEACMGNGQVWVAAGTYNEQLTLKPNVAVYGGFADDVNELSGRNPMVNVTILNGVGGTTVFVPGATLGTTTLDGFTVTNGGSYDIFVDGASPVLRNNTLSAASYGIYCQSGGAPVIQSSVFTANGNGVWNRDNTSPQITGNAFFGNGRAIYMNGGAPLIANNVIRNNTLSADYGAGLYVDGGTPTVANNTIVGNLNRPDYAGAAVWVNNASANVTLVNNIVAFNTSGVYVNGGGVTFRNNDFYGNQMYDYGNVADPTGAGGNIKADPKLADVPRADLHIQPDSPARDAGDDSAVASGDKDMDGQDRVQGPHVDMGADESDDTAYTVAPLVVRVNAASGDDANDGSDWAKAKKTVQAAIASEPGGGDVWVAAGTYNERILIASDIRLYGGFTGTETDRASRNASANLTILDGQYAGGTQVVRIPSGAQRVIFDGFTVRNSQYEGIYISGSSPTIAHNVVTGTSYRGIYVENGGAPLIKDNLITANGNDGGGGGIYLNRSNAVVSGNVITGNHSNYGGAISVDTASPVIVNNVMRDNTASHSGGAAFISGGSASVRNNILFHNRSVYYGGAIRLDAGSPVLANNSIVGNTHDNQGYTGGAVWFYSGTNATLVNNVIAFNDSGLSRDSGTITLRNNDVYGNSSYDYANLTDATGADGNLRVDPVFADVRAGDLHIQNTSPLRNAGDNSAVAAGDVDMDGQIRIQNGSVDIGADESNGVVVNPPSVRVYVRSDGDDANTGASWAAAKKTVQAGIDSALAGGEVWVAAGTYSGAFLVRSGILMYGGFAGTETQLSARNVAANGTILDANGSGNAVTVPSGSRSVTIDGFTIRGAQGQGIYVNGSSPTIRNNTITGNKDRGIYIDSGGAPAILNNLIAANGAGNTGGGIMVRQASSPVVTGNTIADNRSDYGAGLCSLEGSSPVVTSNVFIRNVSTYHGGALRLDNGNAIVNGNTIALNSTSSSSYVGGGIWLNGVTLTLANNIIAFNSSGIYNSGGAFGVRNNDLYGNTEYDYGNLTDLTGSAGNVRVDPKLADLPRGNVHIIPTSPLRDAGEDSVVQIGDVDLDGQARKQGAHVDIGADESNGAAYIVPAFVVRVKTDGDDSADGLTWATAKKTVQAAVNVAAGGEVWVAKGTYQERVTLKANTALYGGFAGAETVRASRDVAANASIIDANGSGSAVYIPPSDPGTTILDGLTLQGGSTDYGGGVRINGSSAIVHNNAITGNKAQSGAGIAVLGGASPTITGNVITANTFANSAYYGYGGGVYCDSGTIPTISGNTISKNVSNGSQVFGAGVYCGSGSFPVISGNTFDSNTANGGVYGYGGAVFCAVNSAPSIAGNVMTGNSATGGASNSTAGWGGAVFNDDYSFPAITGNTMSGNSANSGGGAVYADTESAGLIAGNVITGNTAPYGGAVGLYQSLPIITGNTISANAATTGGAVNAYQAAALISDNLIVNNTATNAAAMVFDASTPVISNNTIAANVGTNGASVTFTGSSVLMANNIVAYNTLGIGRDASAVLSFYNNDVFSNTTNYIGQLDVSGTAGNISADPRFVNRAGNDYHLAAGSPGLDAGDDSVPQPGETDRDGNARALGAHVDMGAYETRPAGYLTRTDVIRALRGSGGLVRTGAEDAILAGQAPNVNVLNLLDAVRAARKAAGLDKNP